MPVHSKIPICTFTFSDNPLLTPQDDRQGQYVCMHALKNGRRLENEKFFELKSKGYRDGIKTKETR